MGQGRQVVDQGARQGVVAAAEVNMDDGIRETGQGLQACDGGLDRDFLKARAGFDSLEALELGATNQIEGAGKCDGESTELGYRTGFNGKARQGAGPHGRQPGEIAAVVEINFLQSRQFCNYLQAGELVTTVTYGE